MLVKAKMRIKYNGKRYYPGGVIEVKESDYEEIKDIVEVIEGPQETKEEFEDAKEVEKVKEIEKNKEEKKNIMVVDIKDITKDKIIEILERRGTPHNPRDLKETLYNLMIEGD